MDYQIVSVHKIWEYNILKNFQNIIYNVVAEYSNILLFEMDWL